MKPTWTNDEVLNLLNVVWGFVVALVLGVALWSHEDGFEHGRLRGGVAADIEWQKRLAEEGLGKWVVDEKTGAREFKVGPKQEK